MRVQKSKALSLFVLDAGIRLIETGQARLLYLSLSDPRFMNGQTQSGGPLERCLPDDGKGFGRIGFAKVVVSIRRRVGDR